MKILIYILLIFFIFDNCTLQVWAPQLNNTVTFSVDFTDRQKNLIKQGLDIWSQNTNGRVNFVEVPENGNITILVGTEDQAKARDAIVNYKTGSSEIYRAVGLSLPSQGLLYIYLTRISDDHALVNAAAHEGGHQIGLHHVPQENFALMNPAAPVKIINTFLTRYDINLFCQYWGCKDGDPSKAL